MRKQTQSNGTVSSGERRARNARLSPGLALAVGVAILFSACSKDSRTPLVIYSPHGRDMLQAFERDFEARNPDIDVQTLDMGSQEVLDRLRSERANPQADVWWGAPAENFETAANEDLLDAFEPSWAGALTNADHRDEQNMWWGNYLTPEVIAYNTELVSEAEAPKDWDEVLDPKWRGKVLIRDPLASGTMRTIFGMIVDRSLRATGDTAAGFEWLRRLDAQTKEYVLNPTMLYQKLARQEGAVTLWDQPDIDILTSSGDYPIAYVIPASGTPVVVDGVAVVRGAPRPEAARRFVEYIGGMDASLRAAREFHRLPARADLPDDSLPEKLRRVKEQVKPEPIDWQRLQSNINTWMQHWDENVRGKGRVGR